MGTRRASPPPTPGPGASAPALPPSQSCSKPSQKVVSTISKRFKGVGVGWRRVIERGDETEIGKQEGFRSS
eukprot:2564793-Rhodomonas_salina.1